MKLIVIGGGPAGMMCAGTAAAEGAEVILIEKNDRLGRKLFISGKGRANVTNACPREEFLTNIVNNPKFLMSALAAFDSSDTKAFYEKLGVPLKEERGGRVFPVSDKSNDILKAHIKYLEQNGVKIMLNSKVSDIIILDNIVKGVRLASGESLEADAVAIMTGGLSYPLTGSTGDGYNFAREAGHKIIPPAAALAPVILREPPEVEGLSLKNVSVSARDLAGKELASEFGEMLFTSDGVSGPAVLTLSSRINRLDAGRLLISIDLKPALTYEQLDDRLLRDFSAAINKDLVNSLNDLLPRSLIPEVIRKSGIDPRIKLNSLDKVKRASLVKALKGLQYTVKCLAPIEQAIVTSGGVDVKEVNPKSMESRLVKGLYFAGEVLDVDALTGGFNIQIALSTGYLAGLSVCSKL